MSSHYYEIGQKVTHIASGEIGKVSSVDKHDEKAPYFVTGKGWVSSSEITPILDKAPEIEASTLGYFEVLENGIQFKPYTEWLPSSLGPEVIKAWKEFHSNGSII